MYKKTCLMFVIGVLWLVCCANSVKAEEKLYFVHQDHLGSTSLVTDSSGSVVSKQVYYPYGSTRLTIDHQPLTIERQYTSQVSDVDQTGLYYYNARYYNPLIAKFTQADVAGDGLNRYSYVRNNPVIITDPSGGLACPIWWPGCLADAFKHDWNALTQAISQSGEALSNNPLGVIKSLATQVVPQLFIYGAAYYAGGEQFAEAVDVTMCSITGGGAMCALAAQMAGPNLGKVDNVVDVVDDVSDNITLYKGIQNLDESTQILPGGLTTTSNQVGDIRYYLGSGIANESSEQALGHALLGETSQSGFSSWTTNLGTARRYAGETGTIVSTTLPRNDQNLIILSDILDGEFGIPTNPTFRSAWDNVFNQEVNFQIAQGMSEAEARGYIFPLITRNAQNITQRTNEMLIKGPVTNYKIYAPR